MSRLVTIMIPAYNQPQYIEQAVKSALMQDYEHLEVVVCDDSSNDETFAVLKPYFGKPRFRYHKNERNLGRVENYRKLLFELAGGEWVVMLDGDDYYIDNSFISRAINLINCERDIVLVGASIKVFTELTNEYASFGLGDNDVVFDGKEVFSKYKRLPNHQTDVYKRSLACELDFYRDPSAGSDSESLYRLCCHGRVGYFSHDVAVWRVHGKNTTYTREIGVQIRESVFVESVYQYALERVDKKVLGEWRKDMYAYTALHLLQLAQQSGNKADTLKILLHFNRYLGAKLSIVFFLRLFGLYKPRLMRNQI